jgi:hypothetical protein
MKSKERGVMKWLTRMNKCIVGKQYKKGGEEGEKETWRRTQLVIKCVKEYTKYAEQLSCLSWEESVKTTEVLIGSMECKWQGKG